MSIEQDRFFIGKIASSGFGACRDFQWLHQSRGSYFSNDSCHENLRIHFTNLYEGDVAQRHEISELLSSLTFLSRFCNHQVMPKFRKIKDQISTLSSRQILQGAYMVLLSEHKSRSRLFY